MYQRCAVIILLSLLFQMLIFLFNEVFFVAVFWFNLTAKVAGGNPRPK